MAGLVPAIHAVQSAPMPAGWVYIVTNRPNGTLYVGVTGAAWMAGTSPAMT